MLIDRPRFKLESLSDWSIIPTFQPDASGPLRLVDHGKSNLVGVAYAHQLVAVNIYWILLCASPFKDFVNREGKPSNGLNKSYVLPGHGDGQSW